MFTFQLSPANPRRGDDRRVRDADTTGVPTGWPMGSAARPLDELHLTLDSPVARRILDRLLLAAGMCAPAASADDATRRESGARLRGEGRRQREIRPALDTALPVAPACIAGCPPVTSPEFAAWLRALAQGARDEVLDAVAADRR